MEKITVYGLPINPTHLVEQLDKPSFCVSYGTRDRLGKQLDQAIKLVANDGILLVDNGAFSNWQNGKTSFDEDYLQGFYSWAKDVTERCPQAVVVIPDVIGGTAEQNDQLILEHDFDAVDRERCMVMWHLDEPISALVHRLENTPWLGIGSSGQYHTPGTPEWHARMKEAFAAIDAWEGDISVTGNVRPRIHLMRAQSQAHLYPVDSADSCNLAINHNRQAKKSGESFTGFAGRIDKKLQASAGTPAYHQVQRGRLEGYDWELWDQEHQRWLYDYYAELHQPDDLPLAA